MFQIILLLTNNVLPETAIRMEELAELLHSSSQSVNGDSEAFFSRLPKVLQLNGRSITSRFRNELALFSLRFLPPGRNLARPFLEIPATDICERFFNMFIGFCLDGYDRYTGHLIRPALGPDMRNYQQSRLSENLEQLLRFPAESAGTGRQGLLIGCRARAAICVLLHRLYSKSEARGLKQQPPFDLKQSLQCLLEASGLNESDRRGILQLFLTATGRKAQYQPVPEQALFTAERPAASYGTTAPDMLMIKEIATDVSTTTHDVKQLVKQLNDEQQRIPAQDNLKDMRRIGSRQAMELLGVGSKKLQRIRDSGKLPYGIVDGVYTYLLKDVLNFPKPGTKSNPAGPQSSKEKF